MLRAKKIERASYWNSISDEQLISAELITASPEELENLVYAIPEGSEEPYVEYSYDLRGTEREKLRCVHGNHPHLAGFVMRKGEKQFLVGHICGAHIYGEDFRRYTHDYDAAVERQDILRRARDARDAIDPFLDWLKRVHESNVFDLYERVQDQFDERMEWLSHHLSWITNSQGCAIDGHRLPKTFFDGFTDPRGEFLDIAPTISSDAMLIVGKIEIQKDAKQTFGRLQSKLSRLELLIKNLDELIELFQPTTLQVICNYANSSDSSKKRRYKAGVMSITCHQDKGPVSIKVPKGYRVPNLEPLQKFRAALAGFEMK
jgi:hypothetical protein